MEIRFSERLMDKPGTWPDFVYEATNKCNLAADVTGKPNRCVRFTLPGASVADHDRVIRALLQLDPDATIRTARAVYESLADFEAQVKARVK